MSRNFYEELLNGSLNNEKVASTQEEVKEVLGELDDDTIEALAEEIGVLSKIAEEGNTVEEKATEQARNTETKSEKDLKASSDKSVTDKMPSEEAVKEKAKAEANKEVEREDTHTDKKKDEVASPKPADSGQDDSKYETKKASEILEDVLKEGAELEEKLAEDAYLTVEGIMKQAGLGTYDYVVNKVNHEKIASAITDKAEKLAAVTGKPVLQVADDLIFSMASLVDEE